MTTFIVNWCKIMFTQTNKSVHVNTATCQGGVISARGPQASSRLEIVSSQGILFPNEPLVKLQENTIYLNRHEASFVNKEVRSLLKAQRAETKRKKQAGIPLPPTPGKIAYAVYQ